MYPNLSMEATGVHDTSFSGFGINFGTNAANREKIQGDMDSWMDEVKMAGGAGLGGIVNVLENDKGSRTDPRKGYTAMRSWRRCEMDMESNKGDFS